MPQANLNTARRVDFATLAGQSAAGAGAKRPAAQSPSVALELDLVTTRDAFDALAADWTALYDSAGQPGQPFQSFAWSWHWANHFLVSPTAHRSGPHTSLHILVARRNGRLVLVWPLVKVRNRGLTELRFLGDPVGEYSDVLVDAAEAALPLLRHAWRFLIAHSRADLIVLGNIRADAVITPLMAEMGAVTTRVDGAPYMDFSAARSSDDYMGRFSGRSRSTRRRKRQKLAEVGALSHRVLKSGPEARDAARQIIELKRKWQIEKGVVSRSLADPRTASFFADVADGLGHDTGCRILTLDCAGSIAAAELTFVAKGQLVNHVLVYDTAHDKHSPGALLTEDSIGLCMRDGIERYDFMGPANGYKLDWSDAVMTVTDYAVPMSLKGRLWVHAYLAYGRERLKKLVAALPASVRRSLASAYVLLLPAV